MNSLIRFIGTVIVIASLSWAISSTDNELWLIAWFLMFIFIGVPLVLVTTRDLLVHLKPRWLGRSQLLLHVCAIFGALIGYLLGVMAVESEHPEAHLHQLLVVIFPLMVYLTPLLMILHGMPLSKIKNFYIKSSGENE